MTLPQELAAMEGWLFEVDTFAVHDGPGIRMAVYLKGCPLACAWCHSPESQSAEPQLIHVGDRCALCGACQAACQQRVHVVGAEDHTIAWERCVACGACVAACPNRALSIKGYRATAGDLVSRAMRLRPFFRNSGGGVTLTGGEVTRQPEFAAAVLAGCQEQGIHTAVETCGASDWPSLERVVEHADLVLYDIKLIDDEVHRRWTGASNRMILRNVRRLAGGNVQVRVPLIPGITDTEDNLAGIYAFVRDAGLDRIALLPYNPSSGAKYEWLGRDYAVAGEPQDGECLERLATMGRDVGLEVSVE